MRYPAALEHHGIFRQPQRRLHMLFHQEQRNAFGQHQADSVLQLIDEVSSNLALIPD